MSALLKASLNAIGTDGTFEVTDKLQQASGFGCVTYKVTPEEGNGWILQALLAGRNLTINLDNQGFVDFNFTIRGEMDFLINPENATISSQVKFPSTPWIKNLMVSRNLIGYRPNSADGAIRLYTRIPCKIEMSSFDSWQTHSDR